METFQYGIEQCLMFEYKDLRSATQKPVEMVQQLRSWDAHAEDQGSHSSAQLFIIPVARDSVPSSGLFKYQAGKTRAHIK